MDCCSARRAFTLIELLVVIAIIAILAVVVVLTLNPAQLLKQSRDSSRLSDAATLSNAIGLYSEDVGGPMGSSSVVYMSTSDPVATTTAGDQCQGLGLPVIANSTYHCDTASEYRTVGGLGWLPVDFASTSAGSPIGSLPIDPINTTSSGYFYTYNTNGTQYELTMNLESSKFASVETSDGGQYSDLYERGTNLLLAPTDFASMSSLAYVQSAASCGSLSKAFSSNVASGDLVIDAFKSESNTVPTPTDSLGTPLVLKASMVTGTNSLWVFAGVAPSSGADTITNTGGGSWPCVSVMEIAGTTGTVNASTSVYGNSSPSTVNVVTTAQHTFIFAAIGGFHSGDTFSASAGFTDPATANANGADAIGAEYAVENGAGTYTPGFTIGGGGADNAPLVSVVFQ